MQDHHIDAAELGIDLTSGTEAQLFRWFLACLLFGKPIQQEIAQAAYEALVKAGITSVNKLIKTDWDTLVALLDEAHYVRYDFSTATKLLQIAKSLKEEYGTVSQLVAQSTSASNLEDRLIAFKGIGPVTALIFTRSIAPIFFKKSLPPDFESARRAAKVLSGHGFEAYLVGGAVRDLWLGRTPKDFDLITNATPDQIMAIPEFKQSSYRDTALEFGVTRITLRYKGESHELEIATLRKDVEAHRGRRATKVVFAELEDDVERRDFTINALVLDPSTNQIIDYVDGIDDLNNTLIRFIGKPEDRIKEDPLRIMRAIRFKNHLNFSYHHTTITAIKSAVKASYIEQIAVDRIRDECTKLLIHPTRHQALYDLDMFGILGRILPEVTAGKGVDQPPEFHAEGDVWQHELLILDYLPHRPSRRLVWAALLHDIGKPATITLPQNAEDRIRFNQHYTVGAQMAKVILKRLNFSLKDIGDITWMIHNHMAIDDLPAMRPSRQQLMFGHPAFEDLLELHRADAAASWRPHKRHGTKPPFKEIEKLWHNYQSKKPERQQPSLKRDLGIDGDWLLKHFDVKGRGEIIGRVLSGLDEWYRDEGIKDKKRYLVKARELIRQAEADEEDTKN